MKTYSIILLSLLLNACSIQSNQNSNEDEKLVTIKDYNSVEWGYGQNLVAEIHNGSKKTVSFVSVEFTFKDKDGHLLNSQKGNTKNIKPNGSGVADSYFDKMPKGSTYSAQINEVIFE